MKLRLPLLHRWWALLPLIVSVSMLALFVVATERIVAKELTHRALGRVDQYAQQYADQLSGMLGQRASELELLSRTLGNLTEKQRSPDFVRSDLQALKDRSSNIVWIGWIDPLGRVVAASNRMLEGDSIATRPVYLQGRERRWFGSLHPSVALKPLLERSGQPMDYELADIAQPVLGQDGQLLGVLAMHIDGRSVDRLRYHVLGEAEARRQLDLVLMSPTRDSLVGKLPQFDRDQWSNEMHDGEHAPAVMRSVDGIEYAVTHRTVNVSAPDLSVDWQVVSYQPLEAALQPAAELETLLLLWGGLAALLLGGLGVWASRTLTRPYVRLFDAVAERIGQADVNRPAGTLDAMLEQVRLIPASALSGSPGDRLLAKVLHDAARIKAMLDTLPAPVYLVDNDYRLSYWNKSAAEVFGWKDPKMLGQHLTNFLKWTEPHEIKKTRMKVLEAEEGPWVFETQAQRLDGVVIWGEWRVSRLRDADGAPVGLMAQVRDLTAEKEVQQRLAEQSETLSAIIQSSSDAVISTDIDGKIQLFNPAAERIFQVKANDLIGQPLDRLLPPRYRDGHHQHLARFAESSTSRRRMGAGLVIGMRADGMEVELEASISQVTVRGRKVLTAILRDVTERIQAERRQARYQLELSELTYQLMEQEKETTRRMAQILHDKLGQTLTALRLTLDALTDTMGQASPPAAQQKLSRLDQLTQMAVAELRQAMMELRPPLLEENGLAAALENELRTREDEAAPIQLTLSIDAALQTIRWPPDVEHAVFMIAREALINAIQHSAARHIKTRLYGDERELHMEVADDGVGVPEAMSQGRPGHLGLVGMRERALAIGARLSIRTPVLGGAAVQLDWEADN